MKYKYILWDWNGTLLDDLDASVCAVNDLLDVYGKEHIDMAAYYSYMDTPIYKFYEHIFDLNVVTMEDIKPLYGKLYIKNEGKIVLAEGALETVEYCRASGIKQYVLSAAHVDDLMRYATRFGIDGHFAKIEASPDYDAGSKIERAKRLMAEEKIPPSECVMIGDTLHDLETADALGVECILYAKGHTDAETLRKTGKTVCMSFDEIKECIKE